MCWDPRQSNDSTGTWARPPVGLGGSPGEAEVSSGSLWGQGHWWQRNQQIFIGVSSPRGHQFVTETWPHLTAYRLQCWDASDKITNRVGTQPHPSADRLPKVILILQPPLNTPLDTPLPTRGTRPSSAHQWTGTSPSHQEACTSPWTDLTHQGADSRSERSYNPATCGMEATNRES